MSAVAARWARLAAARSRDVSLAEGALLIAAEEYEDLDIDGWLARIDGMATELKRRLRPDISATEALLALNHYVFGELGFSGNADDYYDPRNSFLNDVIERRLGIPITLSVLYIEIGRRIGLALHGVSFPGHFLVKCAVRDGAIVIDPYAHGASLGLEQLREQLCSVVSDVELDDRTVASLLAPAAPSDIFARMLRNLRAIYLNRGEREKALVACNRIVGLLPETADEYRERAEVYFELECFRAALEDFRRYLDAAPGASDREEVRVRIAELEPRAARLN